MIKMSVRNTEELGILTERIICETSKISFKTRREYNNIISEMNNDISRSLRNIERTVKFTDHMGNINKEYDFLGVNDTKKKLIKISIKTIMKNNNKICPQKVGQCSLKKFNENFGTNYESNEGIKGYFYNNIECLLNEYLKNTFCCDNTIIYKFMEGEMYDIERIRVPKFVNVIFKVKNEIKDWNESNTVYVIVCGEKYTLGEIQIHNNRNCIKYRFNSETLVRLIEYGYIENLKIRKFNLEYKYNISIEKMNNKEDEKDKTIVKKTKVYKSFNYIGSKKKLLTFLEEKMGEYMGKSVDKIESFGDYFCGTGIVSYNMIQKGVKRVISNDIQHYAYTISSVWSKDNINVEKINGVIGELNDMIVKVDEKDSKEDDFIYRNYTEVGDRMYLTKLNGLRVDKVRKRIEELYKCNMINIKEYHLLIKVLLYGVTAVSNTASVYGAYLKKYKACALKTLVMDPLLVENLSDMSIEHESYNMDISKLLEMPIYTEVCYIDSPYNSRKYDDNYHLLETISRYDYPKIKGKTGLRDSKMTRSRFCLKTEVRDAFDDIYSKIRSKYIFVSYSSEGLVSKEKMMEMMNKYYKNVVCYEKEYQRFKSNRNNQMSDGVMEYLFAGERM
jgi:adenine-specific DNA-methyltransferase